MSKKFDVLNISLAGTNLIEASAGTGKTYSIAILMLRLLLERHLPIDRILMVTFTNKAVAELELRIRLFIRKAYLYATGESCGDRTLAAVVDAAIEKQGKETAIRLLSDALRHLDETQVLTIHGFCQHTIRQFAFETDQPFNQEIVPASDEWIEDALFRYRREVINEIEPQVAFDYLHTRLEYDKMIQMVNNTINQKRFLEGEGNLPAERIDAILDKRQHSLESIGVIIRRCFKEILNIRIDGRSALAKSMKGSTEEFIRQFISDVESNSKYIPAFYSITGLKDAIGDYLQSDKESREAVYKYYKDFIRYGMEYVDRRKLQTGKISYDDLILCVSNAACNRESFRKKMAAKYDAVFIDEFQDTDAGQYTIFRELFASKGKTVFYIGDPKQSIYGWRKADLEVYKKARLDVRSNIHTMNLNFRATPLLVKATNLMLGKEKSPDLFLDDQIVYQEVSSGNTELGEMMKNGNPVIPIELTEVDDDKANIAFVCGEIIALLSGDTVITYKGVQRKITPADIGVIVRTNFQANEIRRNLLELGVPAMAKDRNMVFSSAEATYIRYLIEAVLVPTRGKINRMLFRTCFGFSLYQIRDLDIDLHADIFRKLKNVLLESGIYNMIETFLAEYGIRQICMHNLIGQRVLTNLIHLTEILHEAEQRHQLSPEALITWIKNAQGDSLNDEYEKRIESEEDAVQVITIHSCKGLSFNIVFAPYLNTVFKIPGGLVDFKMNNEYYFSLSYKLVDAAIMEKIQGDADRENRRLLYVTLTRPVYKCYISWYPKKGGPSTIERVLDADLKKNTYPELIAYKRGPAEATRLDPMSVDLKKRTSLTVRVSDKRVLEARVGMYSFSSLSRMHRIVPFSITPEEDSFTRFMLDTLPRGTQTGLFLHALFEVLDFSAPETYAVSLRNSGRMYPSLYSEEMEAPLLRMIYEVMNVEIPVKSSPFTLNRIKPTSKRAESEFYFFVNECRTAAIQSLFPDADLSDIHRMKGHVNGFIDLIFEHEGKYYILDWKSNYLGNRFTDYAPCSVRKAMTDNNYHLQYLLYTVATCRLLSQLIPDFEYESHFGGVIYLFLRGIRKDSDHGIFFEKPDKEKILQLEELLDPSYDLKQVKGRVDE